MWVQQSTSLGGCHQPPHLPLTFIWELSTDKNSLCILISLAPSKECNSVWYSDRSCASQRWVSLNLRCAKLLIESKGGGDSHLFPRNSYTVGFGCTNQISRKDAQVTMAMILHEVLKTAFLALDYDAFVTCKKLDFIRSLVGCLFWQTPKMLVQVPFSDGWYCSLHHWIWFSHGQCKLSSVQTLWRDDQFV